MDEFYTQYYPDNVANYTDVDPDAVRVWLASNFYSPLARAIEMCERCGVPLADANYHRFSKLISCHRMLCPKCSQKDSRAHKRKYGRIWNKLMWIAQVANCVLGYVVFTIPPRLRRFFMDKENLAELHRRGAKCVEEVMGADGSCTVVHLFGDRSDEFHPHVNVVFPQWGNGHVSESKLKELRRRWREMLQEWLDVQIDESEENAHYNYARVKGQMIHRVKYISRSVVGPERFLRLDDSLKRLIVEGLKGFRNVRYHGRLSDRNWRSYLQEIGVDTPMKAKGITCPICEEKLRVIKQQRKEAELILAEWVNLDDMDRGYWYEIPDRDGLFANKGTYKIYCQKHGIIFLERGDFNGDG